MRSKKKKPRESPVAEFRPIELTEATVSISDTTANSDEHGVRLWCSSSPITHGDENGSWRLLIYAPVKNSRGGAGKRFAISAASMSKEDLRWLRDRIDDELRRTRSP